MGELNKPLKEKKRIFIVDDHPIVRQGLTQLINQEPDLVTCGEAEDAPSALRAIERLSPDLVIVDVSLKGRSGIELIKEIKLLGLGMPIVVLSMHRESLYAERALRAGAKGYIMKQEASEKVIEAIRKVVAGKIYLSEKMSDILLDRAFSSPSEMKGEPIDILSDRELEIFYLIGYGFKTKKIADKLNLSAKTVETYRGRIKEKLKLKDSEELLQSAIQWAPRERE
ncbi:MAG: Oxygen regulatory protein NreC [Syntrophorhabdus sp. PtaU1.Bin050]|jgi:DNA-binding NarL/FixJ family response regulator|nr:MAG: Oxygen regulatory protein NreC [Syntrophorhabdus sp. PtaU1.Bin050]